MVSRVFPKSHPRAGEPTYFMSKILLNFDLMVFAHEDGVERPSKSCYGTKMACEIVKQDFNPKPHTIRGSYELWKKRADKINAGEAVLSLRQWSGEPYKSKQIEFMQLEKIGVERVKITHWKPPAWDENKSIQKQCVVNLIRPVPPSQLAKNDGLSYSDFDAWFPNDFDGCIIHFTDHIYANR